MIEKWYSLPRLVRRITIAPRREADSKDKLTDDEKKVKEIMQKILMKVGVLKDMSEEEWNLWTTRKVIHTEFPKLIKIISQSKQKEAEKHHEDTGEE